MSWYWYVLDYVVSTLDETKPWLNKFGVSPVLPKLVIKCYSTYILWHPPIKQPRGLLIRGWHCVILSRTVAISQSFFNICSVPNPYLMPRCWYIVGHFRHFFVPECGTPYVQWAILTCFPILIAVLAIIFCRMFPHFWGSKKCWTNVDINVAQEVGDVGQSFPLKMFFSIHPLHRKDIFFCIETNMVFRRCPGLPWPWYRWR